MNRYQKIFLCLIGFSLALCAQTTDNTQARIDSLEQAEIQFRKEQDDLRQKLDSLNRLVSKTYVKAGLSDTIVGETEKAGPVYKEPDVTSKKLYKIEKGEKIVIIGFDSEWFKIMYKKGTGFLLEELVKHTDKIYNYKKQQTEKINGNEKNK